MFKKSYLLLMFLSAWLCGVTLHAQERLWAVDEGSLLYTMNTDGFDTFVMDGFAQPDFGVHIVAFSAVKNSPTYMLTPQRSDGVRTLRLVKE
jgi:hypothetical protein